MTQLEQLHADLAALDSQHLRRIRRDNTTPCSPHVVIDGEPYTAFCSNDYLGLAGEPRLAAALAAGALQWGAGAGASHLVSGHYTVQHALEQRLAAFVGCERALYFATGFMANSGALPALAGRGDAIFADKLNHASLIDGMLLARADVHRYPHLDLAALERQLARSNAARKLIVSDAVFSMDGDVAPLVELMRLAEQYDAWLYIDDAHGFGVLGPQGRGTLAEAGISSWRLIQLGTLSKAAGVSGAFIAGHADVIEWLMQKTRSYIFTTGTPPALAQALLASLDIIDSDEGNARRAHIAALIERLSTGLRQTRWRLLPSRTPIQALIVGDNAAALKLAAALLEEGLWVPAIRPPTVPAGSARLRISLSAAHGEGDVERLIEAINRLEHSL
ncbi:8-amino-7-oxononanoate synthase [Betaproteobacteria bacterium]|nr:8-amino-7-oxononanoate synthase [Betaproteobacteria bacterium]GHT99168.1 8-amino-7-oxononanoate synthase [Betaproteobacteria bacterium]GHU21471.1 8-amino-7-oxononanoate synthase [Betaproteobacteria bacterium]